MNEHAMIPQHTQSGPQAALAKAHPSLPPSLADQRVRALGNGYFGRISMPSDAHEVHADRLAGSLLSRLNSAVDEAGVAEEQELADCAGGGCGEKDEQDEATVAAAPPGQMAQFGAGKPLDGKVRRAVEPLLGQDLGGVRTHPDGAHGMAENLSARAFTVGKHIYFGRGEYNPGTSEGMHVLLHELVHTTQPGDGTIHRMPSISAWDFRNTGSPATDDCAPLAAGQTLGVNSHSYGASSFTNMMELRAEIASHESGATYDIKRVKERSTWQKVGGVWSNLSHVGPGADDDSSNDDECLVPNTSPGYIYSVDYPGFRSAAGFSATATEAVYKATFTESVDISTGTGGVSSGNTFDWHSVTWLTKTGSTWSVDTGRSEIATGAVTVGTTGP